MWKRIFAALLAVSLVAGAVSLGGCSGEGEKKELNLSDTEGR